MNRTVPVRQAKLLEETWNLGLDQVGRHHGAGSSSGGSQLPSQLPSEIGHLASRSLGQGADGISGGDLST